MDNLTNQNIHYQQQVVDWSIFLTCIALLVAIARFTARWQGYAARNDFNWIDWDDFLIVPALISTIVVGVCWSVNARTTIKGYKATLALDHSKALATSAAKAYWIGSVFYILAITFPKLSICALYDRIFAIRRSRVIVRLTAAVLVANGIAFTVVQIFFCNPPSYYWESYAIQSTARVNLEEGKCMNNEAATLATPVPHIVTDLVLLVLPMPTVWSLQMSRARKIGLIITFLTASIGMVSCAGRWALYLVTQHNTTVRMSTLQTILTILEPTMYLAAACLPPTRSLVAQAAKHIRGSDAYKSLSSWTNSSMTKLRRASMSFSRKASQKSEVSEIPLTAREQHASSFDSAQVGQITITASKTFDKSLVRTKTLEFEQHTDEV